MENITQTTPTGIRPAFGMSRCTLGVAYLGQGLVVAAIAALAALAPSGAVLRHVDGDAKPTPGLPSLLSRS